jgi:hypothetical protein
MKIVENAKSCWRHYSTIALSTAGATQGAWVTLPDEIKADLPKSVGEWVAKITVAILFLGLVGKFVQQDDKPKDPS